MKKLLPSVFYAVEVGQARSLVRLIPLLLVLLGIIALYNTKIYKGLGDQQSMDYAQLARQLDLKQGFATTFIRPYALEQIAAFRKKQGQAELFPETTYPTGTLRTIPDTYNAPGYPILLAALFKLAHVDFDEQVATTTQHHMFAGDRWIPVLNQIFILLTAGLLFVMGLRLFDQRVAWMASVSLLFSEFVWKFSLLAVPTVSLMFLASVVLWGSVELYRICEERFDDPEPEVSRAWAWAIVPGLAVLLGLMALTWLPLIVLVLPLAIYLWLMRGVNKVLPVALILIVALMVAPWFYHWYRACGNPLGSNLTLGLYGQGDYAGDQIYCSSSIPDYRSLFGTVGAKEYDGFLWHFQHGWTLLGSHPMVLLFAASILHEFRRRRVHNFRWLVVGCAFAIIFVNNLAVPEPEPVGAWNTVAILVPLMVLIGSAFFFTLLDRLATQLPLLISTIVVATLALTAAPMLLVFAAPTFSYYNYPPYIPPLISTVARLVHPDQWITSDMPWATAWYGNRVSLWLPDTVKDFDLIYDDINPSQFLLLTPQTTSKPMTNVTTGERKEWLPYLLGVNIPETFPLRAYGKLPGGTEYIVLSAHGTAQP